MNKSPCKNVNVMNSICRNTGRYCIGCGNYEATKVEDPEDGFGEKIKIPEISEKPIEKQKGKFNGK